MGDKFVRVHANRLKRILDGVVDTGGPKDGVFPDSLRTLERISSTQMRRNWTTEQMESRFKIRISGRRSSCRMSESDLPPTVVKLYDEHGARTPAVQSVNDVSEL